LQLAHDLIVIRIIRQFFGIFDDGWNFNRPRESKIAIALLVSQFLNVILCHLSCVYSDFIMNWQSCSSGRIVVGDHVKIKNLIVFVLNYNWVNDCSWAWVDMMTILLFKESRSYSLINENVKQLRIVSLLELLNCLTKLSSWTLVPQSVLLHCGTTNTISIDHNLLWNLTSISNLIISKGIKNESLELWRSISTDPRFLL